MVEIHDAAGNVVATYDYDAWGNQLTAQTQGSIGELNPIRYRGYYYDTEIKLYYLQSRYYNSEWGRFISADVYADTQDGILGTNMYAYCQNDPVNRYDEGGMFGEDIHNRNNALKYGTYYWAYEFFTIIGLDHAIAEVYADTFALANKSVDDKLTAATYNFYNPSIQGLHFNNSIIPGVDSREINYQKSLKRAEDAAKNSDIFGVLTELGKGLHSLQDQIAHSGPMGDIGVYPLTLVLGPIGKVIPYSIHFQAGWSVDRITVGDNKYKGAFLATVRVLRDFAILSNKYSLLSQKIPLW